MRIKLFAVLLLVATLPSTPGRAQSIPTIGPDRLISDRAMHWPLTEPHLAIDPSDPSHLVATAIAVRAVNWAVEFSTTCIVLVSFDAGVSWTQRDLDLEECGDPWVAVTQDGTALMTFLGRPRGREDGLWVLRSTDGGRTWADEPASMGPFFDHQTVTVDSLSRVGSVYLVSGESRRRPSGGSENTVHVSRSDDFGMSFPVHEHVVPSNLSFESQNPVVLSDGALVVPFQDHQARPNKRLERRRSWLVVSSDGGATFSAPRFITESCSRSRPASWPSLAVDHSDGPFHDRLYWICEHDSFEGVLVHYSSDRGETWSDPLRIGHDGVRNPYTKTPVMAVNHEGVLGIVWYDGRVDSWHACHQIFFAYSTTGGESFSEPLAVSTERSCPYTTENGDAAWRWPGGGDYVGMVPRSDGRFLIVWSDSRDGLYRLRATEITPN